MRSLLCILLIVASLVGCASQSQPESGTFQYDDYQAIVASEGYSLLKKPQTLAFTSADVENAAKKLKMKAANIEFSDIDKSKSYDVVLQAGHYGRTRGSTGTSGKHLTEQEAAGAVASELKDALIDLGLSVALIDADSYKSGQKRDNQHYFKTKLFLSFHLDGSTTPCASGPSIGYNPKFGGEKMELIAVAVAISMEQNALDFMRNNFTTNLSHFYSYKHSDSSIAEGILELGELTCSQDEMTFLKNFDVLIDNLEVGITFALGLRK